VRPITKPWRHFGAAGCRYLQIDEVNIAYLCDPEQIAALKARGEHVENLLNIYGAMLNRAIEARPPGMTISMHLLPRQFSFHVRRHRRLRAPSRGIVQPDQRRCLLHGVRFRPRRRLRAAALRPARSKKSSVLGLVTSKTGALESKDELKRRIDEAGEISAAGTTRAVARNAASPRPEEGNTLTEDEQWAKLRLCVDVAARCGAGCEGRCPRTRQEALPPGPPSKGEAL